MIHVDHTVDRPRFWPTRSAGPSRPPRCPIRLRVGTVGRLVCLAVAAVAFAGVLPRPVSAAESPNFIVIMADDLGYGDLSPYGGWIETPALQELADQGLLFTDFHSSGNVCSPTRAGLMTGRYQQRAGIPGVVRAMPAAEVHYHGLQTSEVTFAELLREAGYATAIFGKWHLGYETRYNPLHHGFDEFIGYVSGNVDFFSHVDQAGFADWWHGLQKQDEEGYTTHLITQHAIRFLRDHRSAPFCLYLAHEAPHYPYQGPDDSAIRTVGGDFSVQGSRNDIRTAYREMVVELDRGVGDVLKTLRELGLEEKTLVLFFSDNGANRNGENGPLRGFKGSNWEGGHRVPCLARWPGRIAPGTRTDALTITLDVMPTLLDAAGIPSPSDRALDGVSLLPIFDGKQPRPRSLFWNGRAMRDGTWKLILDGRGQKGVGLYDLATDLGERENLAERHPERVQRMRSALRSWQNDVQNGATPQPDESARRKAESFRSTNKR